MHQFEQWNLWEQWNKKWRPSLLTFETHSTVISLSSVTFSTSPFSITGGSKFTLNYRVYHDRWETKVVILLSCLVQTPCTIRKLSSKRIHDMHFGNLALIAPFLFCYKLLKINWTQSLIWNELINSNKHSSADQ